MTDEQKHLDITKPGNVPVSHTSKPALINSQVIAHDPMMRKEEPASIPAVIEHRDNGLRPTTLESVPETEKTNTNQKVDIPQTNQPDDNFDSELPNGVIENKNPIEDQQSKIEELVNKKTYYLPIQSIPKKFIVKVVVVLLVVSLVLALSVAVSVSKL